MSMKRFSMILTQKQFSVQQAGLPDFTDQITRAFPDIKCGIRHLTQVQDMQWDFFPVQK